ncbi:MAG: PQQ-binding-like beta-propeller repeat protein [Candidatus Omnitrophica bacterium]|nr:PQQ-binding-like beta-propeller repeat protein [Candidatus Omnitrophota bacterium]
MNQSKRSSSVVEVMVFAGFMFSSFFSFAEDWPQYRGPFLDGTTTEKIGLTTWPAEGPKVLWRIPAPLGFSSFTISQGQAFTLVARPDQEGITREVAVAVDASSGKELWSFSMCIMKYDGGGDSGSETNSGGDGPRSTPSIDGDRVYLYDSQLNLYCLGLKDGKTLWQHSVQDEFEGRNIRWQSSASVLIEGDLAIVPGGGAGQSFLAFNKKTGDLAWKSSDQ